MTDFIPLAHTLLMQVDGVSTLAPAPKITCLSGACPTPAWITHPKKFSWISVASIPAVSKAPLTAAVPNYGAVIFLNYPMKQPMGVLLALTMTTFLIFNIDINKLYIFLQID